MTLITSSNYFHSFGVSEEPPALVACFPAPCRIFEPLSWRLEFEDSFACHVRDGAHRRGLTLEVWHLLGLVLWWPISACQQFCRVCIECCVYCGAVLGHAWSHSVFSDSSPEPSTYGTTGLLKCMQAVSPLTLPIQINGTAGAPVSSKDT